MIWPVKSPLTISQDFSSKHPAVDLAKRAGDPVLAPVSGVVIGINTTNPTYIGGYYVIIREDHPDKLEHYTGHHSAVLVSKGQRVTQGQQIARIGSTGRATGPHTHYQIRTRGSGTLVNPHHVYDARNKQGEDMVTQRGLDVIYRLRLGRAPNQKEVSDNLGKTPFDRVDELVVASNEYKERVAKVKAAKALLNEHRSSDMRV